MENDMMLGGMSGKRWLDTFKDMKAPSINITRHDARERTKWRKVTTDVAWGWIRRYDVMLVLCLGYWKGLYSITKKDNSSDTFIRKLSCNISQQTFQDSVVNQ